ncbi:MULTISPECIES: metallophosphoesterase family protein [Cyanophyceae]|uniref:Nuclease SbcCD subunit D n=1 Tax=Leptolyngbya subtilissima DQ-A4 TaxID=2933933 RepID=A0ABV0JXR2_9CYAN|nr:DNA repair exonuclease [Nodosilinea sp. FACHB-141]MBD2111915.1 DNA repair exonuclease [Nodosilinea sp. FACHB-141]
MAKFLHIADIHLGFDRYDTPERTKDFFRALQTVLERYAVEEEVDFVAIAGDLFEHRNIKPATLNQAQVCLQTLKDANIPVVAIEGNHDNRPYGTRTSWLKYLSEWNLLKLLEPNDGANAEERLTPWDDSTRSGGYIDLPCGVRVIGSNWYGATAPRAIELLAGSIKDLPPGPNYTVLMFHHGLEGQISRYAGALRYSELLPLKEAGVDYLALGHIHKNYTAEGWVFNPGSLEANNVEESRYPRGAYLVELLPDRIDAQLKTDYFQRPIERVELVAKGQESLDELNQMALDCAIAAAAKHQSSIAPILELKITGQVGFDRLELDTRRLQEAIKAASNALVVLVKYDVEDVAYQTPLNDGQNRVEIEQSIFEDMLTAHRDYKSRAPELAQGLTDLKDRQLSGADEISLYGLVETLLDLDRPMEFSEEPSEPTQDALENLQANSQPT